MNCNGNYDDCIFNCTLDNTDQHGLIECFKACGAKNKCDADPIQHAKKYKCKEGFAVNIEVPNWILAILVVILAYVYYVRYYQTGTKLISGTPI